MKARMVAGVPLGLLILVIGCCAVMISCSSPPPGNPADGGRWFGLHHCDGCHGKDGTGGGAPEIRGIGLSYRELLNKVRTPKSTIMPAYPADRLSDQQVADILAYLNAKK